MKGVFASAEWYIYPYYIYIKQEKGACFSRRLGGGEMGRI